jgi:tetratricopeptide (TPR) repeat protein
MNYGVWPEVADANMRAFDSSMAWVKAHGWKLQDLNVHNYGHLLQYAHYAYLQSGALAKAAAVRERVTSDYEASGKARELRRWYADVYARRLVELARWDEAKELADRARGDRLTDQALWHAIGLGAVRSGQLDLAREALAIVIKGEGGATSLPARELSGMLHLAEGQTEGMKELADAAEVDSRNLLRIGMPPTLIKPAMELYGEVLLEHGRAEDALKQFERGLVIFRRRPLMLLGAARASQRLGRTATASQYYRQLSEIWASADADHPFASEARQLSPSR